MKPIIYPIVFRFDDMTVPDDETFTKSWGVRHLGDSVYETPESIHPEARFHWLIDGDAQLREFTLIGKRREWARPFRHIWRLVLVTYKVGEGRPITVGMLRQLIAGTRLDQEKSLTPALNRFLKGHDDSEPFTKAMFEQFMNGGEPEEDAEDSLMITLPMTSTNDELLEAIDAWVIKLEEEDYLAALAMVEHHPSWTPELLRKVIKSYGNELPGQRVTLEARRTDIFQRREATRWDDAPNGTLGEVWYDLGIDGLVSDLTATFRILPRDGRLVFYLNDVHVM